MLTLNTSHLLEQHQTVIFLSNSLFPALHFPVWQHGQRLSSSSARAPVSKGRHDAIPRIATRGGFFHTNSLLIETCALGRSSAVLQEEREATREVCCRRPLISTGTGCQLGPEVGSGVSESAQEVSFFPSELFCAVLLVLEEILFKLTAFPDSLKPWAKSRGEKKIIIEHRKLLHHYLLMSPIISCVLNVSAGSHRISSCSLGLIK